MNFPVPQFPLCGVVRKLVLKGKYLCKVLARGNKVLCADNLQHYSKHLAGHILQCHLPCAGQDHCLVGACESVLVSARPLALAPPQIR